MYTYIYIYIMRISHTYMYKYVSLMFPWMSGVSPCPRWLFIRFWLAGVCSVRMQCLQGLLVVCYGVGPLGYFVMACFFHIVIRGVFLFMEANHNVLHGLFFVFGLGGFCLVQVEFLCVVLWRPEALDCRALIAPEAWHWPSRNPPSLGFEPQTSCIWEPSLNQLSYRCN